MNTLKDQSTDISVVFALVLLMWAVILKMVILNDISLKPIGYFIGIIGFVYSIYAILKK